MSLAAGQRVSHYRLIEKIGEGGMGVVWKAEDTVLGRTVAIKLLPVDLSQDPVRRQMLLDEAKVAASVSDAHIAQVYEFEREGDVDLVVMEYVDGLPLNKMLHGRPLPPHKVADYGAQIASALACAHRSQLLHGDLKPGNILVTKDGGVKVVDFGLARMIRGGPLGARSTVATETLDLGSEADDAHELRGTLPYMSPEQVRGDELDARSDIFSFGSVLYEMTTGHQPFVGPTPRNVLREILAARPRPPHEMVPKLPLELERIIQKSLSARRADRFQTMEDLAVDLKRLGRELESGSAPSWRDVSAPLPASRRGRWLWAAGAIVAGIALVVTTWQFAGRGREGGGGSASPAAAAAGIEQMSHRQVTFSGRARDPEISPDGQFVAFVERIAPLQWTLNVQDLSGGKPLEILRGQWIRNVRWSPDGAELLLRVEGPERPESMVVPRLGGPTRTIDDYPSLAWAPDGRRFAGTWAPWKKIVITDLVSADTSEIAIEGDFRFMYELDWSPNGDRILFLTTDGAGPESIWTVSPDDASRAHIIEEALGIGAVRFADDGRSIEYHATRGQTTGIWRVPAEPPDDGAPVTPVVVMTDLPIGRSFSRSRDGRVLAYSRVTGFTNLWLYQLDSFLRGGVIDKRQLTRGTYRDRQSRISPDGSRVVFVRTTGNSANLFVVPLDGGVPQQITHLDAAASPVWSPDGTQIAFVCCEGEEPLKVWTVGAAGGTPKPFESTSVGSAKQLTWAPGERILYLLPGNQNLHFLDPETREEEAVFEDDSSGWVFLSDYSPDGRRIALFRNKPPEGQGIWVISPDDSSGHLITPNRLIEWLRWSDDGEWILFTDIVETDGQTTPGLFRVRASGGERETLLTPENFEDFTDVTGGDILFDQNRLVVELNDRQSDVWLAERQ